MSFFRDRQFRHFFLFLIGVSLATSISVAAIWGRYGQLSKEYFFRHNCSVASSLLDQGVEKSLIVKALAAEEVTPEGEALLGMLGIGEKASPLFLPDVFGIQSEMAGWIAGLILFVWLALLLGAGFFFSAREKVYLQAVGVVKRFMEGDFSKHLSRLEESSLHRLFGNVDNLANILAAQSETAGKAKEFLKDTISDISHQLKTPLAALTMYNEIILSEPENTDTVVKFTEKASGALLRMEQLILALLKITRLDAGAVVFEKQDYPVADVVKRGIGELTVRAKREGKEIVLSGPDNAEINCDLQWTGEAIGNLVKNALDYTKEGGKIEISWEEMSGIVRLSVADNGAGIAEEDFFHMFKRFYRAGKGEGIGLGLPLAKAVMEGQGGMLSAHSLPVGGTAFVMTFLA